MEVSPEDRDRLSHHEQMLDAQSKCLSCKLCGGKALISDAGIGAGYYIRCENRRNIRVHEGCMIGDNRLGGWAYNVMDWWNRLHSHQALSTARGEGDLREALDQCMKQFAFYASEHAKAGKCEKAATNQRFADMCLAALSEPRPSAPEEVAIPAGMKAWHGGECAPDDWDGGEVKRLDGRFSVLPLDTHASHWRHDADDNDIIAYTPKASEVSGDREAIARIVAPETAKCLDNVKNGVTLWCEKNGVKFDYWTNSWNVNHSFRWTEALDTADAILALPELSTPIPTGEALREALRRTADALHNAATELHYRHSEKADDYSAIAIEAWSTLRALAMGDEA